MEQKTNSFWRNFGWVGGAIFVTWVTFAALFWSHGGDFTKSGPYGDTFGILNTLFSGLAFAGMICTLLMQKEELALQRQELRLALAEYTRIAKANEEAAIIAKENLEEQKRISDERNLHTRNQIYAQAELAQLELLYKRIEFVHHPNSMGARGAALEREKDNIKKFFDNLEKLYTPPSKPEA